MCLHIQNEHDIDVAYILRKAYRMEIQILDFEDPPRDHIALKVATTKR